MLSDNTTNAQSPTVQKTTQGANEVDELDKLLPQTRTITTIFNETVEIPIISWRREVIILRALSKLFGQFPKELFESNDKESIAPGTILKGLKAKLPFILSVLASDEALQHITEIAAQILNKETTWVEENLGSPQIVELIIPFLLKRSKELMLTMPAVNASLQLPKK